MCGIYGWQWNEKTQPADWRKAIIAVMLGRMNAKRGSHSWGMYAPGMGIRKGLGSITQAAHKGVKFNTFMAHTRFATTGDKTVPNSHPFKVGRIIGAHNGMIRNHEELNTKYGRTCEVDSEHIFHHLNEGLPLSELKGYGTVEWTDGVDGPNRIKLAKLTTSGDLCVAGLPFGTVWSSDSFHLDEVLEMAGLQKKHITKYEVPTGKVHYVEGGKFFILNDTDVAIEASTTSYLTRGGYNGYNNWGGDYSNFNSGDWNKSKLNEGVYGTANAAGGWDCPDHGASTSDHYCPAPRCYARNPKHKPPEPSRTVTQEIPVQQPQLTLVPSDTTPTSDSPGGHVNLKLDVEALTDDELIDLWWGGTKRESRLAQQELELRYDEAMAQGVEPPSLLRRYGRRSN